jgi:phosphatidate cytidylyltransferase
MLMGLLWNHWSFLILFSVIHFGCWWEYLKLIEKIYTTTLHIYTKLGLMLMGYAIMLWFCGPAYNIAGYGLKENFSFPFSLAGIVLLVIGIFQKNPVILKSFATTALGLLYISLSWGLMMSFRSILSLGGQESANLEVLNFYLMYSFSFLIMTHVYIVSLIGRLHQRFHQKNMGITEEELFCGVVLWLLKQIL